ncbi:hydrogen gas-evolving membrane-bound hydrogenase subunit E [Glycomyces tarimensis]
MLLLAALIALAVFALLVAPVHRRFGRDTGWLLAAGFLALAGLFAAQLPAITAGETITASWPWLPSIDVALRLRLDALALLFSLIILGVGALVMAYCARYLSRGSHVWLYTLMTVFALSMLLLVLADDVVVLFVGWELTTLCSFFLIGDLRSKPAAPALRALLVTASGGLALLTGLILLAVHSGTTRLSAILADSAWKGDSALATTAALLVVVGAMTKSAQLPFHFWLPDAMVASTPVSAYLHAASMVKGGIYLLMRFSPLFAETPLWTWALTTVGLATAVVGALLALKQHDLKALLAYSTISQLGFLVALIGVGTPEALAAAALHALAHALFKATLFMLVGIIDHQVGSRDIRELTGLRRVMPVTATLTGLAGLSLAGVPPLIGFVSKEQMFAAFHGLPGPAWAGHVAVVVAVAAASLTFAYGLRIFSGAFVGPTVQRRLREPSLPFLAPAAFAAAAGVALGIGVEMLNPLIRRVAVDTREQLARVDLHLWHGLSPELAMSAATVAVGTALFVARDPVDRFLQGLRSPLNGRDVFAACYESTRRAGTRIGSITQRPSPAAHLVVPLLAMAAIAIAYAFHPVAVPAAPEPTTRGADWVLVTLLAATVAGAATRRSRVAAIVLIGLTGFIVGLWFLLAGAPDLAITQVLFEVITVVVAVMVLRRLPRRFHPATRRRTAATAGVALAAGTAAAAATFTLTGRREPSAVSAYLLREAGPQTGGSNVVNMILVEFRALDTLGEVTVLVAAGLGVAAIMDLTTSRRSEPGARPSRAAVPDSALIVDVVRRALTPVLVVLSIYLLLRGHHEPGGGFIAGLVGGCGLALLHLSRPGARREPLPPIQTPLLAAGLTVATGTGLAALAAAEPFLKPAHGHVDLAGAHVSLSSSLVFDLGVYLVVLGMVAAALNRLEHHDIETTANEPRTSPAPERGAADERGRT